MRILKGVMGSSSPFLDQGHGPNQSKLPGCVSVTWVAHNDNPFTNRRSYPLFLQLISSSEQIFVSL